MIEVKVFSRRRLSVLGALLITATVATVFTCASLAQSRSESQNSGRPRRTEDVPQATPTPPKKDDDVTLSSDDVVRVDASLTNVFFTAADKQKRFLSTLKREDVRVLEDGAPQEIFDRWVESSSAVNTVPGIGSDLPRRTNRGLCQGRREFLSWDDENSPHSCL